jgi:membrane protease subunit HflK
MSSNDQNGSGNAPWGQGSAGGGQGPDLEDMLRRGQDQLRSVMPGGSFGARGFLIGGLVLLALWLASGIYRVEPDEQGVVMRFGKLVGTVPNGLHYHFPYPVESVLTPKVTRVNQVEVGVRTGLSAGVGRGNVSRDVPEESLMLTGDENIVDVDFNVFWRINNAADFLFNIENQEASVKAVAESSMREVVGNSEIESILSEGRLVTEIAVQELMQSTLDQYGSGIAITQVQLQKVDPPVEVIDSFRDVQAAKADLERFRNQAEAYANRKLPEARGSAARITEAAEGYRNSVIADARGETSRFNAIYDEYRLAPEVTRQRMYLETIERVYGGMDKIIIDQNEAGGSGVVPYLPLDLLTRTRNGDADASLGEQ